MSYRVTKAFTDKNPNSIDNGKKHVYWETDMYPFAKYAGATTKERISELIKGGFIVKEGD